MAREQLVPDWRVQAFGERPLEGRCPSLFFDARVLRVRAGGLVQPECLVVAHAMHKTSGASTRRTLGAYLGPNVRLASATERRREIIGLDVGASETEAF